LVNSHSNKVVNIRSTKVMKEIGFVIPGRAKRESRMTLVDRRLSGNLRLAGGKLAERRLRRRQSRDRHAVG
jgi:hypothetical protein